MVNNRMWFDSGSETVTTPPPTGNTGGKGKGGQGGGGWGKVKKTRGFAGTSLQLISSHDFSVTPAATVDFVSTSISEMYLALVAGNSPGIYGIRVSDNGGSTFYDTAGDYHNTRITSIDLLDEIISTMLYWGEISAVNPSTMFMNLYALNSARPVHSRATGNIVKSGSVPGVEWGNSAPAVVGPFNVVRFVSVSGNLTSGVLYAYKKVAA